MPFVHQVYFWLKNPDNESDKRSLLDGLASLHAIEVLQYSLVGTPASTNRPVVDRSYHVSWLCIFENQQAHDIYQTHPLHIAFVGRCSHLWEKVIIYDSINGA